MTGAAEPLGPEKGNYLWCQAVRGTPAAQAVRGTPAAQAVRGTISMQKQTQGSSELRLDHLYFPAPVLYFY